MSDSKLGTYCRQVKKLLPIEKQIDFENKIKEIGEDKLTRKVVKNLFRCIRDGLEFILSEY